MSKKEFRDVTVEDLKQFNDSFKDVMEQGRLYNEMLSNIEKMEQIGSESLKTKIAVVVSAIVAMGALFEAFTTKAKNSIDLFNSYTQTTLKKKDLVNPEKLQNKKINGYKYDRFLEVSKAITKIYSFISTNIKDLDSKEVIWNQNIFPNMRVAVIGNDLHAPAGGEALNPGWMKGTMNSVGWDFDKVVAAIPVVKAVLITNIKLNEMWYLMEEQVDSLHYVERASSKIDPNADERHKKEIQLAIVRKNFYNFRHAIQIYMYFSSHVVAQFFSMCRAIQKSLPMKERFVSHMKDTFSK